MRVLKDHAVSKACDVGVHIATQVKKQSLSALASAWTQITQKARSLKMVHYEDTPILTADAWLTTRASPGFDPEYEPDYATVRDMLVGRQLNLLHAVLTAVNSDLTYVTHGIANVVKKLSSPV
jgi:hypothetical protein